MDPNAPDVNGNTAEIADDPNTLGEANGDPISLQNLMEWEEHLLSIPIDNFDDLFTGDLSPNESDGTENVSLNSQSIVVGSPFSSDIAVPAYDVVPNVILTDLTGPVLSSPSPQGVCARVAFVMKTDV